MITVEHNSGRLIEVRQTGTVTMEEIQASGPLFGQLLGSIRERVVMCTDWRGMRVLPPQVADTLISIIRSENARVERQVVVVDPNAIVGMQLERLFKEGGKMDRAIFSDPFGAEKWLGEVLGPAERGRVRRFLSGASSL